MYKVQLLELQHAYEDLSFSFANSVECKNLGLVFTEEDTDDVST